MSIIVDFMMDRLIVQEIYIFLLLLIYMGTIPPLIIILYMKLMIAKAIFKLIEILPDHMQYVLLDTMIIINLENLIILKGQIKARVYIKINILGVGMDHMQMTLMVDTNMKIIKADF